MSQTISDYINLNKNYLHDVIKRINLFEKATAQANCYFGLLNPQKEKFLIQIEKDYKAKLKTTNYISIWTKLSAYIAFVG